jgi:hypothetical protein
VPPKAPAPHDYQANLQLLGQVYNGPVSVFYHPNVGLRNLSPRLLDLLHLIIEHLPAPLPKLIDYLLSFYMVGPTTHDGSDVQLGAGAVGHVSGGRCGKLCIWRAVGGEQYLGREETHYAPPLVHASNPNHYGLREELVPILGELCRCL